MTFILYSSYKLDIKQTIEYFGYDLVLLKRFT